MTALPSGKPPRAEIEHQLWLSSAKSLTYPIYFPKTDGYKETLLPYLTDGDTEAQSGDWSQGRTLAKLPRQDLSPAVSESGAHALHHCPVRSGAFICNTLRFHCRFLWGINKWQVVLFEICCNVHYIAFTEAISIFFWNKFPDAKFAMVVFLS